MENENAENQNGDTELADQDADILATVQPEIAAPERIVTPEIVTQAQIRCGMDQDEINARLSAVFDRLESAV
jgi:hypothetical protein